ncbi:NADAR domain-containing protein [Endozoicomonas sp. Mp262]|uniref:NADAR domain-containing protein n=1 Tax=Endozoicomonas sp. Mp262 TaxID=2919499 RepID=UPI0021D7E04E
MPDHGNLPGAYPLSLPPNAVGYSEPVDIHTAKARYGRFYVAPAAPFGTRQWLQPCHFFAQPLAGYSVSNILIPRQIFGVTIQPAPCFMMPQMLFGQGYPCWSRPLAIPLPLTIPFPYMPWAASPAYFPGPYQLHSALIPAIHQNTPETEQAYKVNPYPAKQPTPDQPSQPGYPGNKPAKGELPPDKPSGHIKTTLLGPGRHSSFSDIYIKDKSGTAPITSVNAGDPGLYVGRGTINAAFGKILHRPDEYQQLHHHLLRHSNIGDVTHFDEPGHTSTVQFCTVLKDDQSGQGKRDGTIIVDLFNDRHCPFGNTHNRSMTYVVPPERSDYETDQAFLAAVEQTAANMIRAVDSCNHRIAGDHRPGLVTPILRVCGFSSGAFAGQVPAKTIAAAIQRGIDRQIKAPGYHHTIRKIEFENGSSQLFKGQQTEPPQPPHPEKVKPKADVKPKKHHSALQAQNQQFIDFFSGTGKINGHSLNDILKASDGFLEGKHNYIQALFPNFEEGQAPAPLLNAQLIQLLTSDSYKPHLKTYIDDVLVKKMLPFWGIEQANLDKSKMVTDFEQCRWQVKDYKKAGKWIGAFDHNHNRISRVLIFLEALGYDHYAQRLSKFLQNERINNGYTENQYWNKPYGEPASHTAPQKKPAPAGKNFKLPPIPPVKGNFQPKQAQKAERHESRDTQKIKKIYASKKPCSTSCELEVWKNTGGAGTAAYLLETDPSFDLAKGHKVGTVVAANHGLPLGSLSASDKLHHTVTENDLTKKTQEEAVAANWLVTSCGVHRGKQETLFKKTVCKQWGLKIPPGQGKTDTKTIQKIDYTQSTNPEDYSDSWVVEDACLSANAKHHLIQGTECSTNLIFSAGPNANQGAGKSDGSMQRTLNKKSIDNYPHFRKCVECTLRAALDAAAASGSSHVLMAKISCGVYAQPKFQQQIEQDLQQIINDVLDEPVGPNQRKRRSYFVKVVVSDIDKKPPKQTQTKVTDYTYYLNTYPYSKYKDQGFCFYHSDAPNYVLANFSRAPVQIDGYTWATTEHYFQASKFHEGSEPWLHILNSTEPGEALEYANKEENSKYWKYSYADWNKIKDKVMLKALRAKVQQVPAARKALIKSGNQPIFETSPHDSYWGTKPEDGKDGQNRLGALWMQVRDEMLAGLL